MVGILLIKMISMKVSLFSAVALICLLSLQVTDAQESVRKYTMMQQDTDGIPVSITWAEPSGLGAISGEMNFAGEKVAFVGKNSRPGYFWFRSDDGLLWEFWRKPLNEGFYWEGKTHYRNKSELVKLTPEVMLEVVEPVADRTTTEARSRPARTGVTLRQYRAKVGDSNEAICVIYWQNIKGLDAVDGEFRSGDAILTFIGNNSRSGYLELIDADGRKFELLSSKTRYGKVQWSGTVTAKNGEKEKLTLTAID